jgi:hypothetical protein
MNDFEIDYAWHSIPSAYRSASRALKPTWSAAGHPCAISSTPRKGYKNDWTTSAFRNRTQTYNIFTPVLHPYDVHDSYIVALEKDLHSLRTENKVKVHNFLVNTASASGEVDANFLDYACPHEQCNAGLAKGKFIGIPIFTGRADTGVHLRLAIARPTTLPLLKGSGVELRKIKDASILFVVPLKYRDQVLYHMARLVSGTAGQFMFADVVNNVSEILQSTPPAQLNRSSLAIVRIPLGSPDANEIGKAMGMRPWA